MKTDLSLEISLHSLTTDMDKILRVDIFFIRVKALRLHFRMEAFAC